jgi:hypothetical protein
MAMAVAHTAMDTTAMVIMVVVMEMEGIMIPITIIIDVANGN